MTTETPEKGRVPVLVWSTLGFTLMFAVWLMFGVLGIPIRDEFGLTDVQLSWITAVAVLNGAIWRLPAGILADRIGGRLVMTVMLAATRRCDACSRRRAPVAATRRSAASRTSRDQST